MIRRRRHLALATAAAVTAAIDAYGEGSGSGPVFVSAAGQLSPVPSPAPIQASASSPIIRRKKRRSSTKKRASSSASFPAPVSTISAPNKNEAPNVQQTGTSTTTTNQNTENGGKTNGKSTLSNPIPTNDRPNKFMDPYLASTTPWVRRYLASTADDMLLPVPREFLADGFNLQGLQQNVERIGQQAAARAGNEIAQTNAKDPATEDVPKKQPLFPFYRAALKLILRKKEEGEDDDNMNLGVVAAAEALYVLVHARFCVSPRGLETLRRLMSTPLQVKAARRDECNEPIFGRCPRIGCDGMPLLPCGMSDEYDDGNNDKGGRNRKAMRYCISCGEMLMPSKPSKVDGSAWGTSLCHLLVMTYGANIFPKYFGGGSRKMPSVASAVGPPDGSRSIGGYSPVPQVFGFPVHRMKAAIKYPLLLQEEK